QHITIPVGQSTGTVEFVAPDNVHTTNPDLTNSITGTTGGNYEKLETSGETTITVTDGPGTQNETGLSLTATPSVDEGGQITYTYPIEHCILTAVPTEIERIKTFYAHPQVFQQCSHYLSKLEGARHEICDSSSSAMMKVKELASPEAAAIGSAAGGELYGLDVLAHWVQGPRCLGIKPRRRPATPVAAW
ncbi:prephenate dehydratase domain-containing protein, partial [Pseudomonas auratipiscis]